MAFEQVWRFAANLHGQDPDFSRLFDRAFSDDLDCASTALARLEKKCDPALAAIGWSYFWIRQGEFAQARNELERIVTAGGTPTFWDGMAMRTLGEVCLELGETNEGIALLRRARTLLGEPPP